jgi:transglutaminase-like putative cysteine protease
VRLTPRALPWQAIIESRIETLPPPASVERHKDYFGNEVTTFTILERHEIFTPRAQA